MSALPAPPLPPSPPVRPQGARRRGPRRSARSCFSSGSSHVKCAARSSSFHHSRVVTGLSEPIREEPSIWWQSKLENLTVGVDPLPLVGPVRVLRLLDVAGRVGDAHGPSRAPAYAPAPPPPQPQPQSQPQPPPPRAPAPAPARASGERAPQFLKRRGSYWMGPRRPRQCVAGAREAAHPPQSLGLWRR